MDRKNGTQDFQGIRMMTRDARHREARGFLAWIIRMCPQITGEGYCRRHRDRKVLWRVLLF
jgi:hypothetical protein